MTTVYVCTYYVSMEILTSSVRAVGHGLGEEIFRYECALSAATVARCDSIV